MRRKILAFRASRGVRPEAPLCGSWVSAAQRPLVPVARYGSEAEICQLIRVARPARSSAGRKASGYQGSDARYRCDGRYECTAGAMVPPCIKWMKTKALFRLTSGSATPCRGRFRKKGHEPVE